MARTRRSWRASRGADADILLLPSSDWAAIAEMHARMAIFCAIENGVADPAGDLAARTPKAALKAKCKRSSEA